MRVAIIGCGAIGSVLVEAICRGYVKTELVALMDICPERCENLTKSFCSEFPNISVCRNLGCMLNAKPQLVVEAASQQAVREYVPRLLQHGVSVVVLSVGALLDEHTLKAVKDASRVSGAKVYIPTGAIAGIDAVKALANAGVKRVVLRTYKNVKAFDPETLRRLGFGEVRERAKIFEGRGDIAVKLFPANVNVVAALALASGLIPWVEVYADPRLEKNIHEIAVEGVASTISIRVENIPHPRNPRTSYLAALSAIQLLKQLVGGETVVVGT
ncbi:aspartate dehydrogenase [Candidatus Methanodesulfokora washburnensis]|uniref:L-aspartate dehydrogenase n=1 Tax=Candidatus Methanodesulfokora washburnensis TaxID=2478471 RepID=A0A429GGJ2_9CREN|nr:aspartate dehydrogenase [Candidatus Methanodesulfokores washburnensis]RSN72877.1 aspartate dehydrogenase [Candidatus Methanodesulfokores washburnensis]